MQKDMVQTRIPHDEGHKIPMQEEIRLHPQPSQEDTEKPNVLRDTMVREA